MAANDIKMGKTLSVRYLTSQNATWSYSKFGLIGPQNATWNVALKLFLSAAIVCIHATHVTIWRLQFWTLYGLLFWSFLSQSFSLDENFLKLLVFAQSWKKKKSHCETLNGKDYLKICLKLNIIHCTSKICKNNVIFGFPYIGLVHII